MNRKSMGVLYRILVSLFFVVLLIAGVAYGSIGLSKGESTQHKASPDKEIVVLLHGLGRSAASMWLLDHRLTKAGYEVHRIDYDSLRLSPVQIVTHVQKQITKCCASTARKVHFVGHSLGGLVIRAYLEKEKPENLGRIVMLGTPNQGTVVVDYFHKFPGFDKLGPTTRAIGTDAKSFPLSLPEANYPVGVIAGFTTWKLNEWYLKGADDGLVTIEATKLPNMADFITVNAGHAMLRYKTSIASQVVNFLQTGAFVKDE